MPHVSGPVSLGSLDMLAPNPDQTHLTYAETGSQLAPEVKGPIALLEGELMSLKRQHSVSGSAV